MLRLVLLVLLVMSTLAYADDWDVRRDPFDPAVIAKYKSILARAPHDPALDAVLALYKRYRTVDKLVAEYRAQAASWSTLVVLARLERRNGEDLAALGHLEQAVVLDGSDATTWRELAELRERAGNRISAREAYVHALDNASPAEEVRALRDLIGFAQAASDEDGEERYFTQLVQVTPRDPRAWIERGDAMLSSGRFDLARESFAAAEPLVVNDPERRIAVIVRGARVLQKLGKPVATIRELHRALALVPAGSYAMREVVSQIVEVRRATSSLPAALVELEALWPVGARKHFEWTTLATLYDETGDLPSAIAALKAAVARSPSETVTQLRLIELLDRNHDTQQALERLEALARLTPRDLAIQLSLARRYGPLDERAFATLVGLASRTAKDSDALLAVAQLYLDWGHQELAEKELAKIVALASRDATALAELGERFLGFATYHAARDAYLAASALRPRDPTLWLGLAYAYDGTRDWNLAFEAVEQALALIPDDVPHRVERSKARKDLVRILMRTRMADDEYVTSYQEMWAWEFEQNDDIESGYFLAAYYMASPRGDQPYRILARLHALVPDDAEVTHDLERAEALNSEALGLLGSNGQLRDPFPDRTFAHVRSDELDGPRIGLHAGAGVSVRGDMPLTLDLGVSLTLPPQRGGIALGMRVDWTRRVANRGSASAFGASVGVSTLVKQTPQIAWGVGIAERTELRFGDDLMQTGWSRVELATELSTMLVLRDAPFVVGTRFEAWYSGRVVGLLELGFEWR